MRLSNFVQHIARDLARSERKPRNEYNSVLFAIIHHVVPFAIGETVSVLNRGNGNDFARTLDVLSSNVRQSGKADLPLVSQLGQSFNRSVKRYSRIRSVQLKNVDAVQPQSFEATLYHLPQMIRTSVMRPLIRPWTIPATFGRDHQALGVRRQRFSNQLFADMRTIGVRGIDKVDAQLYGTSKDGQRSSAVPGWSPDPLTCNTHSSEAKAMDGNLSAEGHGAGGARGNL